MRKLESIIEMSLLNPGGVVNDRLIKAVKARVNKPEGVIIIVS